MASQLNFCSACSNRIVLKEGGPPTEECPEGTPPAMMCRTCQVPLAAENTQTCVSRTVYKKASEGGIVRGGGFQGKLPSGTVYDAPRPRTAQLTCPNEDCVSHCVERYGTYDDVTRLLIQPSDILLVRATVDGTTYYLCRLCNGQFTAN